MNKKIFLTKEGIEKLSSEIHHLKYVETKECIEAVSEAREKGDSENSELDVAKENYENLNLRINNLTEILKNAVIINTECINTDIIQILNKVTLFNKGTNKKICYTIVPHIETNIREGKISVNSPVAQAIIGKTVGDVVMVKTPSGDFEFEILNIQI